MAKKKPCKTCLTLIAIFLIVAAVLIVFYFAPKPLIQEPEEKIEAFLEASYPIFAGQKITAKAFSSCGNFSLFLDGSKIGEGQTRVEAIIEALQGTHILEAKNSKCSAMIEFKALEKECEKGERQNCTSGNCPGVQECFNGIYGACILPEKICVPGEKIGCSLDGCKFGYSTCNDCGTGFGKCLAAGGSSCPTCS